MKHTGRANVFDKANIEPEKSFLDDLRKDINVIDTYHTPKEAILIKKALINELLNSI